MLNKYTIDKWNKVETVGDFLNFIEDPNIDYMNWSNSFADPNKSGFWIGAKIKNIPNVTHLLDNSPLISSTELSPTTMTVSELEHHKKFNYGSGAKWGRASCRRPHRALSRGGGPIRGGRGRLPPFST